jgi:hypothetical protein
MTSHEPGGSRAICEVHLHKARRPAREVHPPTLPALSLVQTAGLADEGIGAGEGLPDQNLGSYRQEHGPIHSLLNVIACLHEYPRFILAR